MTIITNDTNLANHALALISEGEIVSIDDLTSKPARVCKQFVTQARYEVLRMARWNCATARAVLSKLSAAPAGGGYACQFQLPVDFLRLMEVNGEAVKDSDEYFEIEGAKLLTNSTTVWIRYVKTIGIGECDPLLTAAIAVRLAAKIAIPLSARIEQANSLEQLFRQRLAEARYVDAVETGSAENPMWDRLLGRSRIGRVRRGAW